MGGARGGFGSSRRVRARRRRLRRRRRRHAGEDGGSPAGSDAFTVVTPDNDPAVVAGGSYAARAMAAAEAEAAEAARIRARVEEMAASKAKMAAKLAPAAEPMDEDDADARARARARGCVRVERVFRVHGSRGVSARRTGRDGTGRSVLLEEDGRFLTPGRGATPRRNADGISAPCTNTTP